MQQKLLERLTLTIFSLLLQPQIQSRIQGEVVDVRLNHGARRAQMTAYSDEATTPAADVVWNHFIRWPDSDVTIQRLLFQSSITGLAGSDRMHLQKGRSPPLAVTKPFCHMLVDVRIHAIKREGLLETLVNSHHNKRLKTMKHLSCGLSLTAAILTTPDQMVPVTFISFRLEDHPVTQVQEPR
jgi:hypothetical protein